MSLHDQSSNIIHLALGSVHYGQARNLMLEVWANSSSSTFIIFTHKSEVN